MLVFNENQCVYKNTNRNKRKATMKRNVKPSRRNNKLFKITKSNKDFLRALGFKT